MPTLFDALIPEHVALKALDAAEIILLREFRKLKPAKYHYKTGHEVVTTADLAANRAIINILKKGTPSFNILSEEGSPHQPSDFRWIVDPLDGTNNFTTRLPLWGISIGLEYKGEVVLGLISLPAMGTRYIARKDGGAWIIEPGARTPKRLQVSQTKKLNEAFGFFSCRKEYLENGMKAALKLFAISRGLRQLGSAVIDATWVASGRTDYSLMLGVRPWDLAAGALLVREAGGRALTPQGKEWPIDEPRVLLTTRWLEKEIVKIAKDT